VTTYNSSVEGQGIYNTVHWQCYQKKEQRPCT